LRLTRRCARTSAGAALALALLTGCTTTGLQLPQGIGHELPPRHELAAVPFFPQDRYQCGPASLAMVLAHRGAETRPDELHPEVYVPERKGSLQPELIAAARERGLLAVPLQGGLSALLTEVAAGNPVLVLQNLGLSWAPQWHYAVAVGYDLGTEELVLRSGMQRRRVTDLAVFERTWARGGHWGVVVTRPSDLPATTAAPAIVAAVHALEEGGHDEAARRAYQAAAQRWPERQLVQMALGNRAYADGDLSMAAEAFRHAARLSPMEPEAWNNLGHVLAQQGCRDHALRAVGCAMALAPRDPRYAESRRQILPQESGGSSCARIRCPVPISARLRQ